MINALIRAGVTGAVIYGALWAVRRYDLATRAGILASELVTRGVGVANDLLTKYDQAIDKATEPKAEAGPDPKSAYGYLGTDA